MTAITKAVPVDVIVQRISEQLQSDAALMLKLKNIGIQPGREVTLVSGDNGVRVTSAGTDGESPGGSPPGVGAAPHGGAALSSDIAAHVFVVGRPERLVDGL